MCDTVCKFRFANRGNTKNGNKQKFIPSVKWKKKIHFKTGQKTNKSHLHRFSIVVHKDYCSPFTLFRYIAVIKHDSASNFLFSCSHNRFQNALIIIGLAYNLNQYHHRFSLHKKIQNDTVCILAECVNWMQTLNLCT